MDSILASIRKRIGGEQDDDYFDPDLIMAVNTAFMSLWQLGVGPTDKPYRVTSVDQTWNDFIEDGQADAARDYVYVLTKLDFDPPASSTLVDLLERKKAELEARLVMQVELPSLKS